MTKIPYVNGKVLEVTGGCTECSVGCRECWARKEVWRMAHKPLLGDKWKGLVEKTSTGLRWTGKIKLFPEMLTKEGSPKYSPLNRRKPTRYFVNSKADLFHPKVPFEFIDKVFDTMLTAYHHTYIVLTKRVKRMAEYIKHLDDTGSVDGSLAVWSEKPSKHIHLGVTICTQEEMWKAEELFKIPAAVNWWSIEPILSEIVFGHYVPDYIVVGCESGPKRRPCKLEHIRSIVQQGKAGVPVYVKQIPWPKLDYKTLDSILRPMNFAKREDIWPVIDNLCEEYGSYVEHDMSKFPEDLQVRDEICHTS